jgi:uncharacterized 2Fe-2S/4Fe-4S cluster protein (DUF4445 family)
MATAFQITVHLVDRDAVISAEAGERLLSVLQRAGLPVVEAPCGGKGTCGKCRVKISREGAEEICLACRTAVTEDLEVWPSLAAQPQLAWTQDLPLPADGLLREGSGPALGVAADIGTTTLAVYLYDLRTGKRIAAAGEMNAQRTCGSDVISRIQYSAEHGTKILTEAVRRQLDRMIRALCGKADVSPEQVLSLSVVGNTVMEHLFAGLSPVSIGVAPFTPQSYFGSESSAAELGLSVSKDALLYLAPAVSGYVGGDITAGLLAAQVHKKSERFLFLDIGTNGEMVLGREGKYFCCATAAGPAFEGAEIAMGMSAESGAVSEVFLKPDGSVGIKVIGGGKPKGICGSGLADALALMLDLGAVNVSGRLLPAGLAPDCAARHIGKNEHGTVFYLTGDRSVFLSEGDVRKLQLAAAAIRAGISVMLEEAAVTQEEVEILYLAGGFGNYIRKESASRIGLLPPSLLHRVRGLGNAAGAGAIRALLSASEREQLRDIKERCRYIELSASAAFMEAYIDSMRFPEAGMADSDRRD